MDSEARGGRELETLPDKLRGCLFSLRRVQNSVLESWSHDSWHPIWWDLVGPGI